MIKKNLREWEDCLPHVEFAYNRAVHSTTQLCPFEVVYGFKPITPLDLLPLPIQKQVNMEASKRADFVRKIHVKTKEAIEKKGKYTADRETRSGRRYCFSPVIWFGFTFARIDFHNYVSPSCCPVALVLTRFLPRSMIMPTR
jgi:hypothetical protein